MEAGMRPGENAQQWRRPGRCGPGFAPLARHDHRTGQLAKFSLSLSGRGD